MFNENELQCNNCGNCSHEHVNVNTGSDVFIKYEELLENARHVMNDTEITFKEYINKLNDFEYKVSVLKNDMDYMADMIDILSKKLKNIHESSLALNHNVDFMVSKYISDCNDEKVHSDIDWIMEYAIDDSLTESDLIDLLCDHEGFSSEDILYIIRRFNDLKRIREE